MARFQYQKRKSNSRNFIISILIFLMILSAFFYGLNTISAKTNAEARDSLENALQRGITQCYAAEGTYPESLDYLMEHYGITYNTDKFYVDYRPEGTNIMPDVTIIEKGE